jgi:probable blue pigment (indigoidine) exporter
MRTNASDLLLTATAPAIWGSTYIVTTEFLPDFPPITVAMFRALPAGLLLLLIVRQLPTGIWWARIFMLGALNFSIFLSMLFIAAYRLPGGVAATVGAVQPLLVVFLAYFVLASPIRLLSILVALIGAAGVALLVLTPSAALDPIGILAGPAGAASMACGMVLSRKWQPPVSLLTFTAWQLTAGGLLLGPVALIFEPAPPVPTFTNLLALTWLGLVGMALTYVLWLRGVTRLDSSVVSPLLLLSPVTAVLLGWLFLNQTLTALQVAGGILVIGSIWLGQLLQISLPRWPFLGRPGRGGAAGFSLVRITVRHGTGLAESTRTASVKAVQAPSGSPVGLALRRPLWRVQKPWPRPLIREFVEWIAQRAGRRRETPTADAVVELVAQPGEPGNAVV